MSSLRLRIDTQARGSCTKQNGATEAPTWVEWGRVSTPKALTHSLPLVSASRLNSSMSLSPLRIHSRAEHLTLAASRRDRNRSLQRSQPPLLSSGMNPNDRLFASNQYAFSSTKIAIVALCLPTRLDDGAGHNDFRRRVRQRSLIR